MDTDRSDRGEEAYSFFCRNLGAIHHALTRLYRLRFKEAEGLEQNVYLWFGRFVFRPGSVEVPVKSLRLPLLVATCRAGLVFALGKLDEKPCENEKLKKILARDPDEVALEIEQKLQRGKIE